MQIELDREAFATDIFLGMNDAQRPVLLIPLNASAHIVLTVPEARDFAENILTSCRKSDRGNGSNDR